jgi:hypothetical protein
VPTGIWMASQSRVSSIDETGCCIKGKLLCLHRKSK